MGVPDSENAFSIIITPLDDALLTMLEGQLDSGTYTTVPITSSVQGHGFERHDFFVGIHTIADNVWFEYSGGHGSTEIGADFLATVIERTTN